ncbi:Sugar transporter ERD6-like 5 [Vitis vinifera]|uniref:Sugar transporter ERD6-like 5 n=1 Tax=Vitis vinifera TaxID=29760 RepID=A0A438F175_VITVI|nr:Sugar transporter ERD6-like 5 [Vitis vinifera]
MERGNMDEGLTTSSLLLAEKEVRDVGYSSPVEHELMDDLGLSLAEYSVFVSIWAFGGIIASLMTADNVVCGYILHHWMATDSIGQGMVPGLLQFIGLFFVPESPRWLAKVGRDEELEVALQRLRGPSTNVSQEAADIKVSFQLHMTIQELARILDLFQRRYAHSLIGTMQFGVMPVPSLSQLIPAPALGLLIIDKFGRRPILMVSMGFCSWNVLQLLPRRIVILTAGPEAVEGDHSYFGAHQPTGVPWLVMSEIYPINIKGSAGGLVSLANWFFSVVVTYTFNYMFEWSSPGTFFFYSLISAATVLFTAKLIPETKGRTLEEIQASMTKFLE